MTNTDDWTWLCEMMEKAGWKLIEMDDEDAGGNRFMQQLWRHPSEDWDLDLMEWEAKYGDWREWLEAGTSPPPF